MDQSINLRLKKITAGTALDGNLVQDAFFHEPKDEAERATRGTLLTLIEASNKTQDELDLLKLTQTLNVSITDHYYHELNDGSPLEGLEAAINVAQHNSDELSQNRATTKLGAIAIWGSTLIYGNPQLLVLGVRRDHEFFELDEPPFGNEILKDDDLILLTTRNLFETVIQPIVREEQTLTNHELVDTLTAKLADPAHANLPVTPLLICEVEIKQVPGEEEIIEIHYPEDGQAPQKTKPSMNFRERLSKILTKLIRPSTIYVKNATPNPRKKILIALIAICLLGGSIVTTLIFKNRQTNSAEYSQTIQTIDQDLTRARELSSLNPKAAQELLDQTNANLDKVLGIRKDASNVVVDYQTQINEIYNLTFNTQAVNPIATQLTIENGKEDLQVTANGVVDITAATIIAASSDWQDATRATSYGDNIYVLDAPANALWKYIGNGGNYSGPSNYIVDGSQTASAVDIAIDGSVYFLYPDRLEKFTLGKKEAGFNLRGIYPEITESSKIATNENTPDLYITTTRGIAVFDKSGSYKSLLVHDLTRRATDIIASIDGKTLYLLADGSWWSINLGQP